MIACKMALISVSLEVTARDQMHCNSVGFHNRPCKGGSILIGPKR